MSGRRVPLGIVLGWLASIVCFGGTPTWRWSNPAPHGAHIFGLTSIGSTVVQVGEYGQAFSSDDLVDWRPLATGVTNMLRSAVFLGSRLIITGEEGLVLYTDTLDFFQAVRLNTTDWLEGVAASPSKAVAVGDNGAIYTSEDGTAWTRQADAAEWLRSVAYGNGTFVAVGDAGFVTTSATGVNWSDKRLSLQGGAAQDFNRVRWTGNRFWILGNQGVAFTSLNGLNWTELDAGTTNDLFSAASDGTNAVIVGRSELRTSVAPFTTWTSQTGDAPLPPSWTYYCSHFDGVEFMVGGRSGMFVEGFRPPGETNFVWFSDSESPRNWMWGLLRVGDIYVACGEKGGIFTSLDGFRFDQESVPQSVITNLFEGIGGTTNMLVSVGTEGAIIWSPGGTTNVVSTNTVGELVTNSVSLLGLVWNEVSPRPTTNELQGVGVFGGNFIVTGGKGTILTSPNAQDWLPRVSGVDVMLSSVATSPDRAVITGDFGTVLTSENGILWSKRSSGVTNWIYQARYLNGQFVAVGEAGLILTSADGMAWNTQTSGATRWLNGVTFESGKYYIAGSQGTMLESSDAVNWTLLPMPTGKSLYDVAGQDGRVLTAGIEGAALRARVIPWTTPVNFLAFNVETNTQAFLLSGELDQRFMIQRSPDLRRWVDIAPAEILNNTGSSVFYDAVVSGAQWFFRTVVIQP